MAEREYEVATFWYDDVVGKVLCYLRWHTNDPSSKVYRVRASSGYEAKKIAKRLRKKDGP